MPKPEIKKAIRRGSCVKIQHTQETHKEGLKFPSALSGWCNLGWRPCKGWVAQYGWVEHSYKRQGQRYYVVKVKSHNSPSSHLVFPERVVHQIEFIPEEPELFLPE